MTTLLLDTHALIWAINEPGRLGSKAIEALKDPKTTVVASAVSAWEIATKHRIGKLPGANDWIDSLTPSIRRLNAQVLAISWAHALLAGQLTWQHRDPFDRMLAAQALQESHLLVTNDPAFCEVDGLTTLW